MYSAAARGLLLLLLPPPPLLVMMLYCINIARAAHTESEGRERLDFEAQGRGGCRRFFRLRGAARRRARAYHIGECFAEWK